MRRIYVLFSSIALLTACRNSGSSSDKKNDTAALVNVLPVVGQTLRNEQTAQLAAQAVNSHDVKAILKEFDSSPSIMATGVEDLLKV